MNSSIKEVYLQNNNQFIMLVTYTPGFDLNKIYSVFVDDLKLKPIFLDNKFNLYPPDIKFINYHNINKIINKEFKNFNLINNIDNMNKYSPNIVIFGLSFPVSKLSFKVNLHIHLTLNYSLFMQSLKDNKVTSINKEYFKNCTDLIQNNNIIKYFNIKNYNTIENDLDNIFNYVIYFWEKAVYGKNYKLCKKNLYDKNDKNDKYDKDNKYDKKQKENKEDKYKEYDFYDDYKMNEKNKKN